ncbi:BON domain-containing protein [Paraburkholderia sp. BL23I1N1]|uniref:BON domain-containing protein n=1 Tax=Paraburkholderia sp. BL23I1N1 TaxID=1938802 RepID=UPI000E752909|nr:BON domain-containing protein [Paraburkholderia sp. BL23I1N1]RKE39007.1 BON domain-containing protein [Paraburkholderia sp. BL23I1N1]
MKTNRALRTAASVLIASASVYVWAQASEGGSSGASSGTANAASGGMEAKDIWKADFALRRKVYAAIVTDKEINAGDISVIVKRGAVTLDGTVADISQIDTATEIAKGVPGVRSVISKLTVKKPFGSQ